jgi:hypothetical protein
MPIPTYRCAPTSELISAISATGVRAFEHQSQLVKGGLRSSADFQGLPDSDTPWTAPS